MATALVPTRRSCENCAHPLIPYGADACWACGGPSRKLVQGRDPSKRSFEIMTVGAGIGGGIAYLIFDGNAATVAGAAIGFGAASLVAGVRYLVLRGRRARQLAAGDPLLALAAGTDPNRARIDAIERDAVGFLDQVAAGLRANADAIAARGSSSDALDRARTTLEDVRTRYEAHLVNTLVASEAVVVAAWLRRITALAALPAIETDQARAVLARFDRDLAAARAAGFVSRARVTPSADPAIALVVRESYPALGMRSEVAGALPPRYAELWDRALVAATPLRTTLTDHLELAAVRAAANVAGQAHLLDNPDRPNLALTTTAPVLGSLEDEVARLVEEAERIHAEGEALREVEATLARG